MLFAVDYDKVRTASGSDEDRQALECYDIFCYRFCVYHVFHREGVYDTFGVGEEDAVASGDLLGKSEEPVDVVGAQHQVVCCQAAVVSGDYPAVLFFVPYRSHRDLGLVCGDRQDSDVIGPVDLKGRHYRVPSLLDHSRPGVGDQSNRGGV